MYERLVLSLAFRSKMVHTPRPVRPLVEMRYLSKDTIISFIDAIYSRIYKYDESDLLERLEQRLPEKIYLLDT